MATLDPPLDLLRSQTLACTTLELSEIGWIAGASHRQSGPHFPEYPPPPGNPPYEVDAIDVPHKPSAGADMHVMTEALRLSCLAGRERRLRLVIFDGEQFSSYDHVDGPAYTWRPYHGEDDHSGHAHIERHDTRRDDLHPWEIDMFDAAAKAKLDAVYAFLFVGGDGSSGELVPAQDRDADFGHPTLRRKGNSGVEQLASIRRLAAEAAAGTGGTVDVEALADALAARLSRADADALAAALTLRFNATPSV